MTLPATLLLTGLMLGPTTPAADCYYAIVWGAQPPVFKAASRAHSFATFVHVDCAGQVEEVTISWLPVADEVRPLARRPEPGRNYTLQETFDFCCRNRMVVSAWGPYQVTEDLWHRAVAQKSRLDGGSILYRAADDFADDSINNCLHAVGGVIREPGERRYVYVFPANWGESGSFWMALLLRPWYVEPCRTHPGVMCRLGLDPAAYTINDLSRNPTTAPLIRVTQAVLHRHLLPNRVRCD